MNALESGLMPVLALVVAATPVAQSANATAARRTAAQQAMNERRFDDAAGIYRELLNASPDDPATLMALGAALVQGRHPDQAVAPLEHAVQLNPDLTGSARTPRVLVPRARTICQSCRIAGACRCRSSDRRRAPADAGRGLRPFRSAPRCVEAASRSDDTRPEAAGRLVPSSARRTTRWQPRRWQPSPVSRKIPPGEQLLVADAIVAHGPLTDAFFLYRQVLERLPSMVSIHDAIARIYERSGHADWAVRERRQGRPAIRTVRDASRAV